MNKEEIKIQIDKKKSQIETLKEKLNDVLTKERQSIIEKTQCRDYIENEILIMRNNSTASLTIKEFAKQNYFDINWDKEDKIYFICKMFGLGFSKPWSKYIRVSESSYEKLFDENEFFALFIMARHNMCSNAIIDLINKKIKNKDSFKVLPRFYI